MRIRHLIYVVTNISSIVCLLISLMLVGCTTSLRGVAKGSQISLASIPKEQICVANPEMGREYKILEWSDIYTIGKTCEYGKRITLHKLQKTDYQYNLFEQFHGALGKLVSIGSLGILPIRVHEAYLFTYGIEEEGIVREVQHNINVQGKTSLWEIFRLPFVNEERIVGLALRRQYLHQVSLGKQQ